MFETARCYCLERRGKAVEYLREFAPGAFAAGGGAPVAQRIEHQTSNLGCCRFEPCRAHHKINDLDHRPLPGLTLGLTPLPLRQQSQAIVQHLDAAARSASSTRCRLRVAPPICLAPAVSIRLRVVENSLSGDPPCPHFGCRRNSFAWARGFVVPARGQKRKTPNRAEVKIRTTPN